MGNAPEVLRTERFVGRRIGRSDLADFQAFYADEEVMRTLSADGRPWPRAESARLFKRHVKHWKDHGFGTWFFRDRHEGRFVGRAGLRRVAMADDIDVEVFYGVASDLWGERVGTEIAREIVRVAFEEIGLAELVGFTLPDNIASQRILKGIGFSRDGEITHAGLRHFLFRLRGGDQTP